MQNVEKVQDLSFRRRDTLGHHVYHYILCLPRGFEVVLAELRKYLCPTINFFDKMFNEAFFIIVPDL